MRIDEQGFSAKVELPCKIFCGPGSMLEFSGTAVNIDTGSLMLRLGAGHEPWNPAVGERVLLELQLPVGAEAARAKCLSVRARVAEVREMPDGSRRLEMKFRKASFKDRIENGFTRNIKTASNGWKM